MLCVGKSAPRASGYWAADLRPRVLASEFKLAWIEQLALPPAFEVAVSLLARRLGFHSRTFAATHLRFSFILNSNNASFLFSKINNKKWKQ